MHFIGYLVSSDQEKTRWLLHYARRDPFFAAIVAELVRFGFDLKHPLKEGSGVYVPSVMSVNTDHFKTEFLEDIKAGKMKAKLRISSRHGAGAAAHHFLHELVHFWQDMHGLFVYPLQIANETSVQLDLVSQVAVHKLCEAMAATEAIRGSYRLKTKGYPQAWRGAMGSINWRGMAKIYEKAIVAGEPEYEAARLIFHVWYAGSQAQYYEAQVVSHYQPASPEYLRRVVLSRLIGSMPQEFRPNYLLSGMNIDDEKYMLLQGEHGQEEAYGRETFEDMIIGTPPYLWRVFTS
jgi:hypothetical protein